MESRSDMEEFRAHQEMPLLKLADAAVKLLHATDDDPAMLLVTEFSGLVSLSGD